MNNLIMFVNEEDGMGTVEIILIIVVLIALVAIFKEQITKVVNKIITAIGTGADGVIGNGQS